MKDKLRKQIEEIIIKSLTDDGYTDELLSLFSSTLQQERQEARLEALKEVKTVGDSIEHDLLLGPSENSIYLSEVALSIGAFINSEIKKKEGI